MPIVIEPGSTASPAGPAMRKPMATNCIVVFHLASAVTGSGTRSSARYSRRPETRISRHRMTIAAQSDQAARSCGPRPASACSRHQQLVGDRIEHLPSEDCCDQARAR